MYTKKIYFSGGNFHELQEVFAHMPGVVVTCTGYINGDGDTTYADVAAGRCNAYMGVEVTYNPKKMDISKLLDILFAVVNPYVPDGQGKARGEMYRAGVFYVHGEDEPQIQLHLNFIANRGKAPAPDGELTLNDPNSNPKLARRFCAVSGPLRHFQAAEEEHQDYLTKNPQVETYIDFQKLREYVKF
ncbi:peptide-methionine (S)-S-oxide reductase [Selenomonas ruminantium]|uniref:peptide-methionine (S)-S-oxide reductase n=1 Tax=Selenomonas ruminantium TaxID=971 RepID=UPI000423742A|nr:peptide-methionine (S)-S-oxide reductase [Selenomonas ruminantium]